MAEKDFHISEKYNFRHALRRHGYCRIADAKVRTPPGDCNFFKASRVVDKTKRGKLGFKR
jgi:hypothetical protein